MTSRLCLFDLDRTLVLDRTVERLATHFGLEEELDLTFESRGEEPAAGIDESARIIRLFEGVDEEEFAAVCRDFRLRHGAEKAVQGLHGLGFRVGVVSASYRGAAEAVREHLGLDFAVAAEPEVKDGRLTGALAPSPFMGPCGTHICKQQVLDAYRTEETEVAVAVGDGLNDRCMLEVADVGIALAPCPLEVRLTADVVVHDLEAVPAVVQKWLGRPVLTR